MASRTRTILVALVATGVLCAGCASGASATFKGPAIQKPGPPVTYLDVSDPAAFPSEAFGTVSSQLLAKALPAYTTFYEAQVGQINYDGGGSLLSVVKQAGPVSSLIRPSVVTVSVGITQLFAGTSPAAFASALGSLLKQLRASGALTMLVSTLAPANLAPLAPAGSRAMSGPELAARIGSYDSEIASEAARYGAIVVNVHKVLETAVSSKGRKRIFRSDTSSFGPDHFQLTAYGESLVTGAFLTAIKHHRLDKEGVLAR